MSAIAITPEYWEAACQHLARRDRVMNKLIPQFGEARLARKADAFTTLARSLVGQQISPGAAQTLWGRLVGAHGESPYELQPARLAAADVAALRGCGLPKRKAEYLLDLAAHFQRGDVHVADWQGMDDEAIIDELVAIRGIGRWTAEMFLIFHLMRPNVLPLDDVGLIAGISRQYFSGEPVSRAEARELGEGWAPYRSVATWYLWRSLE